MMRLIAFILDLLIGWLFEEDVVEMPCETVETPDTQPVRIKQLVFEYEPITVDVPSIAVEQLTVNWRDFKKYNQLVNNYFMKGGDTNADSTIH